MRRIITFLGVAAMAAGAVSASAAPFVLKAPVSVATKTTALPMLQAASAPVWISTAKQSAKSVTLSVAPKAAPDRIVPTPEAEAYVAKRLDALVARVRSRPSFKVLSGFGISPENDAYERAAKIGNVPPSIGFARELRSGEALAVEVDPALVLSLATELGRAPSEREIDARASEFDRHIAELNARLAERRDEIAVRYRETGEVPRELEKELLRPFMDSGAALSAYDAENESPDRAANRDRLRNLIVDTMNREAAGK